MKDKEIAKIICKECAIHKKDCTGGKANLPCLMAEFCAKTLYNADYRKLPKDSVVLSREELNEQLNEAWDRGIEYGKKIASKETAEKIYKEYLCDILSLEAKEEFAKQFGVEIN